MSNGVLLAGVPLSSVLLALFGLWVVKIIAVKAIALRRASQIIRDTPGQYLLYIDPFRTLALVLASIFPLPGQIAYYSGRFSLYARAGSTLLTSVRLWTGQPYFFLSDADAIKQITSDRRVFRKDIEAYEVLQIYGPSIVGVEDSDWKRHRAIVNPAFNEANNALVWRETTHILSQWFEEQGNGQVVDVDVVETMNEITLRVISSAGFGLRMPPLSGKEHSDTEHDTSELTFPTALKTTIECLFVGLLTPNWLHDLSTSLTVPIPWLSKKLRTTRRAFSALREHLIAVISHSRAEILNGDKAGEVRKERKGKKMAEEGSLLRNLVQANLEEGRGGKGLGDEELLSNVFLFLLAGHETSTTALAFTSALLALYPEVQDKLYEEARKAWPSISSDSDPVLISRFKEDFDKLEYTLAAFREALRLYPAEPRLGKLVTEDTSLTYTKFDPAPEFVLATGALCEGHGRENGAIAGGHAEKAQIAVPKGSVVIIDIWGLHMNPLHWGSDVEEFRPERFMDRPDEGYRWPRDAFLAFSAGARACIGLRFAMTESVCILASLVRRYEIKLPAALEGLSKRQQKEELLKWRAGVTTAPTNVRVRLVRRAD